MILQENHGDIFEYTVNITNYEEESICQVAEEFNINVITSTNIPLNIGMYKDANYTEEFTSDDSFRFNAGVKEELTVYIRIEWDAGFSDYSYSQEVDIITLYINITQID